MGGRKCVYKWSAIDRVCNSVMTFAGNVVLARILSPDDFGLLAMVAIFVAIAYNISGCGLSDGLIKKPHPTERDYSTVFVFNLAFGLMFCAIFILSAQPIADFFGHQELVEIMWAIGICFVFSAMTFTQETRMRKELDMKRMAIVRLSATASSLILGIYLALAGYGFWALVSTRIFLSVFLFIFYVALSRWIPRLAFYKDSFKEMFGYGVHLMLSYVFTQICRNINTSVIGQYSSAQSGIYSQAQKMQEVPYYITESVFNWPFFAVLSNEEDESKRKSLAQNMLSNMVFINVLLGCLLLLLSSPGFQLLYGAKWVEAIPIFRVLIIFGICSSLKFFFQTVMKTYGMTKAIRNLTFIEVVLQLALLAIFFREGIMAIALTQIVAAFVIMLWHCYYYKQIEEISLTRLATLFFKPMIVSIIALSITGIGYYFWNGTVSHFINCILILVLYAIVSIAVLERTKPAIYMQYRAKVLTKLKRA